MYVSVLEVVRLEIGNFYLPTREIRPKFPSIPSYLVFPHHMMPV